MLEPEKNVAEKTATVETVGPRGERLYPSRSSRLYWLLTRLREEYVAAVNEYLLRGDGSVLIDYGCGNMPYRSIFPVSEYLGADFPGNPLAQLTIDESGKLPVVSQSASAVLSSQVLEHVADVGLYLTESHRVLRKDGMLFLSTHGFWKYHPDPNDYWRWTCDGLSKIIKENGFDILSFRGVLGLEASALQLWQDSIANRIPYRLRSVFFRYMQWRIQRADKAVDDSKRAKDACVFVVVARKRP